MAEISDVHSGNSAYTSTLEVTVQSQNVAANSTTVAWVLRSRKASGSGFSGSGNHSWSASVNGSVGSQSGLNWSFTSSTPQTNTVASGTKTIVHDVDGTKTIAYSASVTYGSSVGTASMSGTFTLPPIPRGPRLKVGSWRQTIMYLKIGGTWRTVVPYLKVNGSWKVGGG